MSILILKKISQRIKSFKKRNIKQPFPFDDLQTPFQRRRAQALLDLVQKTAASYPRPLRILHLGQDTGVLTCCIAELGHRTLGIDPDADKIHTAKLFVQEELLDGIFLVNDVLHTPNWERTAEDILGGKPDLVVLTQTLNLIPQVEFFFDRLSRWMETGSHLILNEENPNSWMYKLQTRLRYGLKRTPWGSNLRTFEEWKDLLESAQFQVNPPLYGVGGFRFWKPSANFCRSIAWIASKAP